MPRKKQENAGDPESQKSRVFRQEVLQTRGGRRAEPGNSLRYNGRHMRRGGELTQDQQKDSEILTPAKNGDK